MTKSSGKGAQFIPSPGATIAAELIAIIIFIILSVLKVVPFLWIVVVALVSAGVILIKIGPMTLWERLCVRLAFFARKIKKNRAPQGNIFDSTFNSVRVGMQWEAEGVTTALRLTAPSRQLTPIDRAMGESTSHLDLSHVAHCLTQFDISLSSVTFINIGHKTWGNNPCSRAYQEFLGGLNAVAHRESWLILTLRPSDNLAPIKRRGGGTNGTIRTMGLATRRVAGYLNNLGVKSEFIAADQLVSLDTMLNCGYASESFKERWNNLFNKFFTHTYYGLTNYFYDTSHLEQLWQLPSQSTALSLTFSPNEAALTRTVADHDSTICRGLVRLSSTSATAKHPRSVKRTIGLQGVQALVHDFFSPRRAGSKGVSLPIMRSGRLVQATDFSGVSVPISGTGQVIGLDETGRAITVSVWGQQAPRVQIAADAQLVKQILVRSMAIGARVLVSSMRPQVWKSMYEAINDSPNFAVITPNEITNPEYKATIQQYSVIVFDVDSQPAEFETAASIITVHEKGTDADTMTVLAGDSAASVRSSGNSGLLLIEQAANNPAMVRITAGAEQKWVQIRVTPAELYLTGIARVAQG